MTQTAVAGRTRHETSGAGGSWQIGSADDGWWARERTRFITERLQPQLKASRRTLDCGCGRGDLSAEFARVSTGLTIACDGARHREWRNLPDRLAFVVCDAARLPFRDGAFDVVAGFDLVEHFADDQVPLAEMRRVTLPNGQVCLTVPASPRLWSSFDESVGHHRRYVTTSLRSACRRAGLTPVDDTHFFSWLVLPAWITKRGNRRNADRVATGLVGGLVDRAVAGVASVERAWLRRRRLPFGTSLWSVSTVEPGP